MTSVKVFSIGALSSCVLGTSCCIENHHSLGLVVFIRFAADLPAAPGSHSLLHLQKSTTRHYKTPYSLSSSYLVTYTYHIGGYPTVGYSIRGYSIGY